MEDLTTPAAVTSFEEITDWEDRMTRANYSEYQRDMIRQCQAKTQQWLDFCATAGWELKDDNPKEQYQIFGCTS